MTDTSVPGSSDSDVAGPDDPTPPTNLGFGVDVGGSGIKGGIVDLDTGELVGERFKVLTPQPATPEAVARGEAAAFRLPPGPSGESYWRDVGTLDAYWRANLDLASVTPELDMYDRAWPIRTRPPSPPEQGSRRRHVRS